MRETGWSRTSAIWSDSASLSGSLFFCPGDATTGAADLPDAANSGGHGSRMRHVKARAVESRIADLVEKTHCMAQTSTSWILGCYIVTEWIAPVSVPVLARCGRRPVRYWTDNGTGERCTKA